MQTVKLIILLFFAVKMDGIGEKIEQMLIELKEVSNEVKGVSTKFDSLESKLNNCVNTMDNDIQKIDRKVKESLSIINIVYTTKQYHQIT